METHVIQGINRPVGVGKRFVAGLLDVLIISMPLTVMGLQKFGDPELNFGDVIFGLYNLLLPVLWTGYTVGKRIMKIRIVKVTGEDVGLWTMIKRSLIAGLVYGITFGIGFIVSIFMVALREDKRSIHDFIAGTYVTESLPTE